MYIYDILISYISQFKQTKSLFYTWESTAYLLAVETLTGHTLDTYLAEKQEQVGIIHIKQELQWQKIHMWRNPVIDNLGGEEQSTGRLSRTSCSFSAQILITKGRG